MGTCAVRILDRAEEEGAGSLPQYSSLTRSGLNVARSAVPSRMCSASSLTGEGSPRPISVTSCPKRSCIGLQPNGGSRSTGSGATEDGTGEASRTTATSAPYRPRTRSLRSSPNASPVSAQSGRTGYAAALKAELCDGYPIGPGSPGWVAPAMSRTVMLPAPGAAQTTQWAAVSTRSGAMSAPLQPCVSPLMKLIVRKAAAGQWPG